MYVKCGINKYHIGKVHKIDTYCVGWRKKRHIERDRDKKSFFASRYADVRRIPKVWRGWKNG